MRKLLILSSFFLCTPFLILITAIYLSFLSYHKNTDGKVLSESTKGIAYAALPPADSTFENTIEEQDSKTETVRQFLARYDSPLEPYAPDIIIAAKRYDLDYRLLPAIAMQESTLCKKIIADSHNCWGWGIYGSKVTKFSNYPQAIETITKSLSTKYKDKGLITPFDIATLYNPGNTNNWIENVTFVMNELK